MPDQALTAAELEARLDEPLDPVLSSRRTAAGLGRALAPFGRAEQDFVLRWVDIIAKTNAEMAYQFAAQAPRGLALMGFDDLEDWIIRAMDVYDGMGLYPASAVFADPQAFAAEATEKANGVVFEDVAGVLELFVRGLSGRPLKLDTGDDVYTDTGTLYLPPRVAEFPDRTRNFLFYKAMAAHQWAQTWYGTFRVDLDASLARYPDPARALRLFHVLEGIRLEACLGRDLVGLHRDLVGLRAELDAPAHPASWGPQVARLTRPQASARDTLEAVARLYDGEVPAPLGYQGCLFPERVRFAAAMRVERDREQLRAVLAQLLAEVEPDGDAAARADRDGLERFGIDQRPDTERPGELGVTLTLDGRPLAPPEHVRALMGSIIQDLGHIPDDYLVAAGDGVYHRASEDKNPDDVWKGTYHEEGAFLYHEWDHRRQHYRKHWCVLREVDVHPMDEPFVERTRTKYLGLIMNLRKTFEALRGQEKLLKKQKNGDNIDLDALVEGYADMRTGMELSERLFTKLAKLERNIAVMFMVDMSGSTKGWINDAEREALVLLCEALEVLGDRYAIYGFSGITRKRCELYRIKRFDEPYNELVQTRIAGIRPQDYTRMGVTIRHLTKLLNAVEARTKLLITLSDGKPDDYDGYRGDYGIEDTRQALIEAKRAGIHPFCITIDSEARDYLPHMYGPVNWTLIEDVRKLPLKVSDIYRRLTT